MRAIPIDRLSEDSPVNNHLSVREKEALQLASDGCSLSEIGCEMGVSQSTVKTLLVRARRKLNARNTTHAVAIAIRCGLI